MNQLVVRALGLAASHRSNGVGIAAMKLAIALIFLWIGMLKFVPYEADSITPFVANSPFLSFFYSHPGEYAQHLTKEGSLVPAQRIWQTANHTYAFSRGLGVVELLIAGLTLAGLFSNRLGLAGALLAFATPFVTLTFLVTTPEAWVPSLGDAEYGFPYLSGAGRLVLKDVAILAGAWLVIVDTARALVIENMGRSHSVASELLEDNARALPSSQAAE